jgi:hypothetical protein
MFIINSPSPSHSLHRHIITSSPHFASVELRIELGDGWLLIVYT